MSLSIRDIAARAAPATGSGSSRDDALLFDRMLAGDDRAAVALFEKFNHQLYLYCWKIIGDADAAEDMTQEVWVRVVRMRAEPQPVRNPSMFLLRVARNLCLDHLRSRRDLVRLDSIDEASHPSVGECSGLEEIALAALDSLSFDDRELLILNIYCGYGFDEIAVMLEISPNAIWTRASRARARLRTIVARMIARPGGEAASRTEEQQ